VVGWLVQQQHVRGRHQGPRQVQANTPATGEVAHRALGGTFRKAQTLQQALYPPFGAVAVSIFHRRVQGSGALEIAFGFRACQVCGELGQPGVALHDVAAGGLIGACHLLCHVCQAQVAHAFYLTDVCLQLPQQHGQNRLDLPLPLAPISASFWPGCRVTLGALQQQLATSAQFDIA
jgi:hypothetical protein